MSTLIHTRRKHPPTQVESNLTSMIDVVFLLIVFFVLVSQVVSREAEPLDLPEVPDAAAAVAREESRLVVNVLSDAEHPGIGLRAMVLGQPFSIDADGCEALAERVAVDLKQQPDLAIHCVQTVKFILNGFSPFLTPCVALVPVSMVLKPKCTWFCWSRHPDGFS